MLVYDLPPELLLTILELCENQNTYALALCCRDAYQTLSSALAKHQKLWRQWNVIDSDDNKKSFHKQVLRFTRKPKLASYVETLAFDDELEKHAYTESESAEMLNRLSALGASGSNMFESIFGDLDEPAIGLIRSHFDPNDDSRQLQWLSAYLVVMTPNLRRLECFGSLMADEKLLLLLANVARISTSMSHLPLHQLRVVEVKLERGIDEGGLPMDWLLAAMSLPSVRTFAARRMNSNTVCLEQNEGLKSGLESLILEDCTFEPDVLARVLGSIQNLKTFAYSSGEDSNVGYGYFSPKRMTAALLLHAGHSLEHLTIRGHNYDVSICRQKQEKRQSLTCRQEPYLVHNGYEWPCVSLADFDKLKTLRCLASLLHGDPAFIGSKIYKTGTLHTECRAANGQHYMDDDFLQTSPGTLRRLAFATRLPQSLKSLHLEEYPCHTPLAYYALSELVQKVDGLLPSLKELYLHDWSLEYLQEKGFLGTVAQRGLKYKALHDPFQLSTGIRCNYDSASIYQVDYGEDVEN